MDRGVARILETLARLGLEENTLVLFTSDNGPQFGGEGDHCTTRYNCGFNGAKGSVYEGGIRVPMLLRWPAGLPGGRQVEEMVHFADWFPTLLAAAGLEPPARLSLDGVNVLPVLRGEAGQGCTRRFWQWNRYTPVVECNAAARDGDWKLVRPAIREAMAVPDLHWLWVSMYGPEHFIENGILQDPEPSRAVPAPPPPELYNLAEDPLEQRNLASEYPEVAHRLLAELESWFEEVEAERRTIDD
jgi:arylsulfatase A